MTGTRSSEPSRSAGSQLVADSSAPVIYFVFTARPVPGTPTTARLAGLGLSGDNADDILARNSTTTGIGATKFFPYPTTP